MIRLVLSLFIAGCTMLTASAADVYKLDGENTKIEFTGAKKDGKHTGGFKTLEGTVTNDGGWKIELTIQTASIYSDNPGLTNHLKGGDFFGVKDHPTAKFVTTKIEKGEKGMTVRGKLTMLGKEKEISFPAEITTGDTFTLKAEFSIDRTDFGMNYAVDKVEKSVALKVEVKAKK